MKRNDRAWEAIKLRMKGCPWQEIADRLSYSGPGAAYNAAWCELDIEYRRRMTQAQRRSRADASIGAPSGQLLAAEGRHGVRLEAEKTTQSAGA